MGDELHDFDAVRSERPTLDELRLMRERAQDEASGLGIHRPHAAWEVEYGLWMQLAGAAYTCEAILIRRFHAAKMPPPS